MEIPTKAQRNVWRKSKGHGMVSAIGEYTPEEFWVLLDAVDALEKENERLASMECDCRVDLSKSERVPQ